MTFSSFIRKNCLNQENIHWIKKSLYRCTIIFFATISHNHASQAQQIGGEIVVGLNATQITGDDLAGYNKPGILVGFKSSIYLSDRMDFNLELLYSERGSKSQFFGTSRVDQQIKLQYLEIPLVLTYLDWLSKDADYYRMHFHVGVSFGRLFNSTIIDDSNAFQAYEPFLNKTDLGAILGATYHLNAKLGIGLRYNNSINKLFSANDIINAKELRGYFLSLRFEYSLL